MAKIGDFINQSGFRWLLACDKIRLFQKNDREKRILSSDYFPPIRSKEFKPAII